MMNFWNNLQPRERVMLAGGAAALLLLLGYALLVEPYFTAMERMRQDVAAQRETLVWMRQAAAEAKALRGGATKRVAATGGQSLLALADTTAKASGLAAALKRVQPDGQRSVRVWLEQAPFDAMMQWLDTLGREHGVQVTGLVVEPLPAPGSVDARVVLEVAG
jgi:general secretion pathway protein M